jgi:hypothetical protein
MALWNDDDVHRPEWTRVMVSEHVISFTNYSDRR